MRHLAAAIILALSALPPLALAQSADRPGQKAFQAGDRWEWRQLRRWLAGRGRHGCSAGLPDVYVF